MRQLDGQNQIDAVLQYGRSNSAVLHDVLEEFHRQRISYCYWKSSRRVRLVLAGNGDFDLLIERMDQHRAERILLEHGFKRFPSVAGRDHPSIVSFLGYDESSGRLIHLHLHVRLIVGERLLKNYRIPWEEIILNRAVSHPALPLRMIDPTSEALLLMVRVCLEMCRLDPITFRTWQETRQKFALDHQELATHVDRGHFRELAVELFNNDLADTLCDAFYGGQPLEGHKHLRQNIKRHFAVHRTYNRVEARLRAAGRAAFWAVGGLNKRFLHLPRPWSRIAPGGGCVVALIGIDGSGKTTLVAAIQAWLGSEVDVVPIYFGTGGGRPSLMLRPFKLLVPLVARLLTTKPKGASHGEISEKAPGLIYSAFLIVWAMLVALEKRMKLLAARRAANRGLIVLADRYPQNEIVGFNDGPLLTRLSKVPRWLRVMELAPFAYARRLPPDLVIKLAVTAETAARREPDMDRAIIRERIADVERLTFSAARVARIDAEQPLPEVIRAVKNEVWRIL
jgi:hypothetical protein